jgi:hypothetical protein
MRKRAPLIQGAYTAKSYIAEAQRCINLYPEVDPEDAPYPTTHYPTPGLVAESSPPTSGAGRGLYRSSKGELFAAVGSALYHIDSAGQWTSLGTISAGSGIVKMGDNGITLVVVDGTSAGWQVDLSTLVFSELSGSGWLGSTMVGYLDTFLIFNQPGTQAFYYSQSNATTFNALNIANKTGYPDNLVAAPVLHREIWLIGELTTEVWYDAGASDFAFQIMPGVFIEHGCCAPYSIAQQDLQLFWLSQDEEGRALVLMGAAYQAHRISTHAIENAIQNYATVTDAVGYCYQQEGHTFYVLTFPSADATWCYDVSTGLWHQRAWIDQDGNLHRHRGILGAACYGKNYVLDWQTGQLYSFDLNTYTDNGREIVRIRSFPHIKKDNVRVRYKSFVADIECGQATGILTPNAPQIWLRWSDNGGFSWGNPVQQSMGGPGQYVTSPQWQRLGIARDRVFELSWSANIKTALNGGAIDSELLAS